MGTVGSTARTQPAICANVSFGTGGSHGWLGHPLQSPAHQTNSKPGSFALVNVPVTEDAGVKSNEFVAMFVAENIVPAGVLSAAFNDPSKAKFVPDPKRELLTGLLGQSTVQVVPEHVIA